MKQPKFYLYFLILIFSIQISAQNNDHQIDSQLKLINDENLVNSDFFNNPSFLQDNLQQFNKPNKSADTTIRMDSIISYSDNGRLEKQLFQYNQNSKIIEWLSLRNDSTGYYNLTKTIRSYDDNNNLETQFYSVWFEEDWFDLSQFNFLYDAQGNIIQQILKTHSKNEWENSWRSTIHYDTLGITTFTLNEIWIDGDWQNDRFIFGYYSDLSNLDSVVYQKWEDDQWKTYRKTIYTYNGPNFLFDSYTILNWNGTSWVNTYRRNSIRDPLTKEAEVIQQVWSDENWVNSDKTIYSFNEFDFIEKAENYIWEDGNWINGNTVISIENPDGFIAGLISNKVEVHYSNSVTSINENNITLENFSLNQNYPNPFNPTTTIQFSIPKSDYVTLKIYDVLGNEIQTLISEVKPQGIHEVTFDGSDLASGTYFYQLKAGNFLETKKFILLK